MCLSKAFYWQHVFTQSCGPRRACQSLPRIANSTDLCQLFQLQNSNENFVAKVRKTKDANWLYHAGHGKSSQRIQTLFDCSHATPCNILQQHEHHPPTGSQNFRVTSVTLFNPHPAIPLNLVLTLGRA
jgi:hypothetical protein